MAIGRLFIVLLLVHVFPPWWDVHVLKCDHEDQCLNGLQLDLISFLIFFVWIGVDNDRIWLPRNWTSNLSNIWTNCNLTYLHCWSTSHVEWGHWPDRDFLVPRRVIWAVIEPTLICSRSIIVSKHVLYVFYMNLYFRWYIYIYMGSFLVLYIIALLWGLPALKLWFLSTTGRAVQNVHFGLFIKTY